MSDSEMIVNLHPVVGGLFDEPRASCQQWECSIMATGMFTRIARRTRREWFLTPVQPGTLWRKR